MSVTLQEIGQVLNTFFQGLAGLAQVFAQLNASKDLTQTQKASATGIMTALEGTDFNSLEPETRYSLTKLLIARAEQGANYQQIQSEIDRILTVDENYAKLTVEQQKTLRDRLQQTYEKNKAQPDPQQPETQPQPTT